MAETPTDKKPYVEPTIEKVQKLAEITEGPAIVVGTA